MNDKILSFLGLCRRAGKLIVGAEPSIESINKHKAKLIIFAKDFSKNSSKPVLSAIHEHNIKALTLNRRKDELSYAIGKLCGVVAVEDEGFAKKLIVLIENDTEN